MSRRDLDRATASGPTARRRRIIGSGSRLRRVAWLKRCLKILAALASSRRSMKLAERAFTRRRSCRPRRSSRSSVTAI